MAINFPDTPANGQVFLAPTGVSYIYSSSTTSWQATDFGYTGSTGFQGSVGAGGPGFQGSTGITGYQGSFSFDYGLTYAYNTRMF